MAAPLVTACHDAYEPKLEILIIHRTLSAIPREPTKNQTRANREQLLASIG